MEHKNCNLVQTRKYKRGFTTVFALSWHIKTKVVIVCFRVQTGCHIPNCDLKLQSVLHDEFYMHVLFML